jgi:hypothetical protein
MQVTIVIAAFLAGFFPMVSAQYRPLLFSEIMINPTVGKDKGTWIELYNPLNTPYDLSN